MLPSNITIQEICQLIGYKELCNFSLGKQVEDLTKQLDLTKTEDGSIHSGPQDT